jgi:hypothetical protein
MPTFARVASPPYVDAHGQLPDPQYTSGFGATSKLARSCSLGANKNRSRHCLPWHRTARLRSQPENENPTSASSKTTRVSVLSSDHKYPDGIWAPGFEQSRQEDENGDCGLRLRQARSSGSTLSSRQTEGVLEIRRRLNATARHVKTTDYVGQASRRYQTNAMPIISFGQASPTD